MQQWLQDNVWIFVFIALALIIILLALSIFLLVKVKVITRNTVDSSLKMAAQLMFESDHGAEFLDISIYNTNFRDITIRDFGIDYLNQHLNFVAEYGKLNQLGSLPVVPARSSISFRVDPQRVEDFILAHNYKSKTVAAIYNVVVDSIGNQFVQKNKGLTRILSRRQKNRVKEAKRILHDDKVEKYRASHDDHEPLSNFFWNLFHRGNTVNPEIVRVANLLSANEKFTTAGKAAAEAKLIAPAETGVVSSDQKDPATASEIKMTYLEPEKKAHKKKARPLLEEDAPSEKPALEAKAEPKKKEAKVEEKK